MGRQYLMISNDYLHHYKFFTRAMDYGKNLHVSWYLVCEPHFMRKRLEFEKLFKY